MTTITFHGGIGVIGSSKILIEQDGWRVLLDIGLDIPHGDMLLRHPARLHEGRELADRIRVGEAPRVARLYRAGATSDAGLADGGDGRTAVFVSHAHLDHIGLAGWVDPAIPMYASAGTVGMMTALAASAAGCEGAEPRFAALDEGEEVAVGPMSVRRLPVDHDVPGASGYLVRTGEGTLAYTGDIRLHGRNPQLPAAFAEAAAGVEALVVDGTGLSAPFTQTQRSETECDQDFDHVLAATPGLVLTSIYPRNIERVRSFAAIAAGRGRRLVWPADLASFLRAYGVADVLSYDEIGLAVVAATPQEYVLQLQPARLTDLLDLPTGPGSVFVHANGEPLGPFDPNWSLLRSWLDFTHTPLWTIGSSGHCTPGDLHTLVAGIAPQVVFPLHSAAPQALVPPPGTLRVLPERGRSFRLGELVDAAARTRTIGGAR